jgi:hypothetical protein
MWKYSCPFILNDFYFRENKNIMSIFVERSIEVRLNNLEKIKDLFNSLLSKKLNNWLSSSDEELYFMKESGNILKDILGNQFQYKLNGKHMGFVNGTINIIPDEESRQILLKINSNIIKIKRIMTLNQNVEYWGNILIKFKKSRKEYNTVFPHLVIFSSGYIGSEIK